MQVWELLMILNEMPHDATVMFEASSPESPVAIIIAVDGAELIDHDGDKKVFMYSDVGFELHQN